jgi:hypothetical protein
MPVTRPQKAKQVKAVGKTSARKSTKNVRSRVTSKSPAKQLFGKALSVESLIGLTGELQMLRQYPPVTQKKGGRYEGDILGFVRGLRLSARVLYFLREHLSHTGLEISWGHLLSDSEESCSPECDIIVHEPGHVRRWNGFANPVMNFAFIRARSAKIVVSCKSRLTSIDNSYPKVLKKFGVDQVFLFAETCRASQLESLRKRAKKAGYAGVWCLYTTAGSGSSQFIFSEPMLIDFADCTVRAATSTSAVRRSRK